MTSGCRHSLVERYLDLGEAVRGLGYGRQLVDDSGSGRRIHNDLDSLPRLRETCDDQTIFFIVQPLDGHLQAIVAEQVKLDFDRETPSRTPAAIRSIEHSSARVLLITDNKERHVLTPSASSGAPEYIENHQMSTHGSRFC